VSRAPPRVRWLGCLPREAGPAGDPRRPGQCTADDYCVLEHLTYSGPLLSGSTCSFRGGPDWGRILGRPGRRCHVHGLVSSSGIRSAWGVGCRHVLASRALIGVPPTSSAWREDGYPGWTERAVAAIGVRTATGSACTGSLSMSTDLSWFATRAVRHPRDPVTFAFWPGGVVRGGVDAILGLPRFWPALTISGLRPRRRAGPARRIDDLLVRVFSRAGDPDHAAGRLPGSPEMDWMKVARTRPRLRPSGWSGLRSTPCEKGCPNIYECWARAPRISCSSAGAPGPAGSGDATGRRPRWTGTSQSVSPRPSPRCDWSMPCSRR
jgi:hypothetical protein